MGLRAGLDRYGKSRLPPGFDPRTFQPVGSRYTNYATQPTPGIWNYFFFVCGGKAPNILSDMTLGGPLKRVNGRGGVKRKHISCPFTK